ncbi:MAG: cupin domain-containing protein [Acidimicrobiia bacterium]|nr:cupin domain-containing protein [Acidimicrobiia bacterium]
MSDPTDRLDVESIKRLLDLQPLVDEGGWWSQVWYDERSSAIHYLLTPDDFSALHRLPGPEVYHHYLGAPVELVTLDDDSGLQRRILGPDLAAGQRPALVVDGGHWQGSRTTGAWSLVGTTMAPRFEVEDFELGDRAALTDRFPEAAELIDKLTRS